MMSLNSTKPVTLDPFRVNIVSCNCWIVSNGLLLVGDFIKCRVLLSTAETPFNAFHYDMK